MNISTIAQVTAGSLEVRTVERRSYTEYYITSSLDERRPGAEEADTRFSQVAALVAEHGIEPMLEKIYGQAGARRAVLASRARAFEWNGLDAARPYTYVEGQPAGGSAFAGFQIWGVAARHDGAVRVRTTAHPGLSPARCWTAPGYRVLYLPHVDGSRSDGTLPACPTGQAVQMFENAVAALDANGFTYPQVARTWIYLSRLLDWYGEFNRVRTAHHARVGLVGTAQDAVFPASTGIQGRSLGRECFMDLLAIDTGDTGAISMRPLRGSRRQPPAYSYGSAFSRGMSVATEGKKTIYVSGTASIDRAGRSVHIGDAESQSVEMLLNIAALLEQQSGGLEDICAAMLYCKNPQAFEAYRTVCRLMHAPAFPLVAVIADVCRADLLVEMEAVAVI